MKLNFFFILFILLVFSFEINAQGTKLIEESDVSEKNKLNFLFLDILNYNQERSWFAPLGEISPPHKAAALSDKKPLYLFTAQLSSRFLLIGTHTRNWALTIDPIFNVRMFQSKSFPVRTPSYHIGINFHRQISMNSQIITEVVRYENSEGSLTQPEEVSYGKIRYKYFQSGLMHYSNGQEGLNMINGSPNEFDGNFSTYYLIGAFIYGKNDKYVSVNNNFNFTWAPKEVSDDALPGRYNFLKVGYRFTRSWFKNSRFIFANKELVRRNKEKWRIEAGGTLGLSKLNKLEEEQKGMKKRINIEITGIYVPYFMNQTGLFCSVGYYGEDPYNIWYMHRYPFFRLGLTTAPFRNNNKMF